MRRSRRRRGVAVVVVAPFVAMACAESSSGPTRSDVTDAGASDAAAPIATGPVTPVVPTREVEDASSGVEDDGCERAEPSRVCGVHPQCGCASGHTCDVVDFTGNVGCITAGRAPMGHPCTATSGCSLGLTCVFGTCHAYCDAPDAACGAPGTGRCLQVQGAGGEPIPHLAVCRVACSLLDTGACGGATNAGVGVCSYEAADRTDCRRGGSGRDQDPCPNADSCGPGLVCVSINAVRACRRWCRVGASFNDCGAGKTCTGFTEDVKVGGVTYGVCP